MCTESETCYGYSESELDDEPCDICKACDKLTITYEERKPLPKCHVANGQLRCDRCNHRLRTRMHTDIYELMYPYCPWCGAPVSIEAQELERRKHSDDTYPKVEPPKDVNGEPIYVGDILRKVFNGEDTDIIVKVSGIASDAIFVEYECNGRDYETVSDIMMTIPFYEVLAKCFRHIDYREEV